MTKHLDIHVIWRRQIFFNSHFPSTKIQDEFLDIAIWSISFCKLNGDFISKSPFPQHSVTLSRGSCKVRKDLVNKDAHLAHFCCLLNPIMYTVIQQLSGYHSEPRIRQALFYCPLVQCSCMISGVASQNPQMTLAYQGYACLTYKI